MQVGREHFEARREALEALKSARAALQRLLSLGGYAQQDMIDTIALVAGAERWLAGAVPQGPGLVPALLSDTNRRPGPRFPNYDEAEGPSLERGAQPRDGQIMTVLDRFPEADDHALAEADGKRHADTFRKRRKRG